MKRTFFLLFLISLFSGVLNAQVVHHHDYTTYYNAVTKEPDSVVWDETPAMVSCPDQSRANPFKQDPQLPGSATPADYAVNSSKPASPKYNPDRPSWIDEGHLFSYQDAMCSDIDKYECFYMANMLPQVHAFNAGDWKTLEVQERVWAHAGTIHILAGGIGINKSLKNFPDGHLPNGEMIPAYMWKAIYMNGHWRYWIMPNQVTSVGHAWDYWGNVSRVDFDRQTGLSF